MSEALIWCCGIGLSLLMLMGPGWGEGGTLPREALEEMVYLPEGEFLMGTSEEEAKRLADQYGVHPGLFLLEAPKRKVRVKAFWIDRFPVTNSQYREFVKATGHRSPWGGVAFPAGTDDYPVVNVTWDDAAAYAKWAGKRLPTEEEWEKAARGTDGRTYPWGNDWKEGATQCRLPDSLFAATFALPVGCFPEGASPFGVMDLCGNVAEWTGTPACPSDPGRNWAWYVVKGASAAQTMRYSFRCAARAFSAHNSRSHSWLGFRCAKDAEGALPSPQSLAPLPKREAPPPQLATAPREDLHLKEPIHVSAGPMVRVPFFPEGYFGLSLPEQIGAEGLPFGWSMKHTPIQWRVNADNTKAEYDTTFEDKAVLRVTLQAGIDHVDFTLALKNLTDKPFTGVHSNTCFNCWKSPYVDDPECVRTFIVTDSGPTCVLLMPPFVNGEPLHRGWDVAGANQPAPTGGTLARLPIMFTTSADGRWVVAQAYGDGVSVAGNAHYSCLHVRPRWPDVPPGEEKAVTGKLYFLKGGSKELLARWSQDFGGEAGRRR